MNQHKKTVIVIAGPTASGKTALSLDLAEYYKTEIISADSRQCYKELNIGVAKPTERELQRVKHHFINSHSIQENVSAQTFEQYAMKCVTEILQHNDTAILVGGTGLYIKAFCQGLDAIPVVDEAIRKNIIEQYDLLGLSWLQDQIKKKDPGLWNIAEQQNPHRLIRALEVLESTGKSITVFRKQQRTPRPFNIIKFGINIPKDVLHQNINKRVDAMIENGLVNEVQSLLPFKFLNALQTVGYSEIFQHLEGGISLQDAVSAIKQNTRQYAKRQITWFKKDEQIQWIKTTEIQVLISKILSLIPLILIFFVSL